MPSALEQYKAKSSALAKMREHRTTIRRAVDAGEMAVGAAAAGAVDMKLPSIMGAKPSLLTGIAFCTAGLVAEQRDAFALGMGMLLPHAYFVGAGLASG